MKSLIAMALIGLTLAGCTTETKYGECVGAFDARNPKYEYKLDTVNTVLGIVFIETIFVPVIIVADETVCPVGPAVK
jgi:hypothetical protein